MPGASALQTVVVVLFVALVVRATGGRTPRRRRADWLAVVLAGTLVVAGVVRGDGDRAWASAGGRAMKAEFLAGCEQSAGALARCGCVFERLAAEPGRATPRGFAGMAGGLRRALRSGDLSRLPRAYVDALTACRR